MTIFYNQFFNPATINPQYYYAQHHEWEQEKEILDAQKAVHDLCTAVKKLDPSHQQQAFWACLSQMAAEMGW